MFESLLGKSANRLQLLAKVLCVVGVVLAAVVLLMGLVSGKLVSEVLYMLKLHDYATDSVIFLVVVILAVVVFVVCWVAAIRCYAWGCVAGLDHDEGIFSVLLGNCAGKLKVLSTVEGVLCFVVPVAVIALGIGGSFELTGIGTLGGSFGDSSRVNAAGVMIMISILLAAAAFFALWVSALQDRACSDAVRGTVSTRRGLLGSSGSKLQALAKVIAVTGVVAVAIGVRVGLEMLVGTGKMLNALVGLACALLVGAVLWYSAICLFACGTACYGEKKVGGFKWLLGNVEAKVEWIAKLMVVLAIIGVIAGAVGAVIELFTDGFGDFVSSLIGTAQFFLSLWIYAMTRRVWSASAARINSRKCLVCGAYNEASMGPCVWCGACLLCGTLMEAGAAQCPGCRVSCCTKT